jgi:hypothetical protein
VQPLPEMAFWPLAAVFLKVMHSLTISRDGLQEVTAIVIRLRNRVEKFLGCASETMHHCHRTSVLGFGTGNPWVQIA